MKHLSIEQIFEYIDGKTGTAESRRIAVHLQECPVCRKEVDLHRSITSILEESPVSEPSPAFSTALMNMVMNEPIPSAKQSIGFVKQIGTKWLVAASIIITLGVFIASVPQKQIVMSKPLEIQHILHGYSNWMMSSMHYVTDFFTSLASFFPVKNVSSLLMMVLAGLLLWTVDIAAKKRFLRTR